ncbi:MAG: DNA-directed RNA polymerase subunit omega [Planctomycetes bacterium]|nr:DNA-directed RNA polymerase subunit omega [Planctomycetota bacterium]MCB9882423.1 DNA-directed RNA polymerase subunit omega [Planctomycetota bacterium]MCB9892631.1 DNA-directed RNA polymerase subunit omega [Planctomycetota bacterium]MCB9917547.1 DNA-directed RNA polymerase subunit omega [Planctomycetota bacterium]
MSEEVGKSLPVRLMEEVGASYRKTALIQKRVRELVRGQRPLYETRETNPIAIALEEVRRGLIELAADDTASL